MGTACDLKQEKNSKRGVRRGEQRDGKLQGKMGKSKKKRGEELGRGREGKAILGC